MPKFRLMLSAAPAILACTFAAPVFAQEAPAPQEAQTADEGATGDIIVTATRRSDCNRSPTESASCPA